MKKLSFVVFCLIAASCGKESGPTQYNYKTIQVTSIYTDWKKDNQTAMQMAEAEFGPFSKSACRETIHPGWSLTEVTNKGELNCEQTPEGHHCRFKNVELKCQQVVAEFPS
ncbi:MAG: hypothetical protein L0Y39_09585 [Methylococcaceae bacterium]|nr:hypothetical protein [Methylococcaceae bacterium]